ncbi:Ribosomal RNA small subunit methyltransferase A [invertebrate metagenome]|uniref:Ribosomal RNA small subunit methyltransferase A n=1 Tax=invertebrate metagenome TaxID=1711999 RepID=A0A2H9T424_9ZZZZ
MEKLFEVKPGSFKPAPKVDSAIVRLVPYNDLPFPCQDETVLDRVVRDAFSQRRKTIRNTLKQYVTADELSSLGIDPGTRPETLSIQEFVSVSNYLVNRK